jgi:hypothetical protein
VRDELPGFVPGRPQDLAVVGNIVTPIDAYDTGALGPAGIPLSAVDRIIPIAGVRRSRRAHAFDQDPIRHLQIRPARSEICSNLLLVFSPKETALWRLGIAGLSGAIASTAKTCATQPNNSGKQPGCSL